MTQPDTTPPSRLTASIHWQEQNQEQNAPKTAPTKEPIHFVATSGTGHKIFADPDNQIGAKPTELVLMGLGSCASVDVVGILKKARQVISDVKCQVSAKRADTIPAVFTDIHLHFVVTGRDVKPEQVAKAVQLSADKYCSVGKMLSAGGVHITHDFEIIAQ